MTMEKLTGKAQASGAEIRIASFLSCVILGLAIHLFAFTNLIPNSDGMSRMFEAQQMTISGRWFLHYASMFHGFLQAPALIGMLSMVFLGCSALLTADLLNLRRIPTAIAVGASFVMIPALAYTFLYMFTASAYSFAILLSVLSVWLVRKKKYGIYPAVILLACSVGTYQAYFAVAASLCLICVLLDLLNQEIPVRKTVLEGLKLLLMLGAATMVYSLILAIFLKVKHLELLEYRGMNSTTGGSILSNLAANAFLAVKELLFYFIRPANAYSSRPLAAANCLFLLAGFGAGISILVRKRLWKEPVRLILVILAVLLLPLAFHFTRILSTTGSHMRYSFTLVYVLCAVMLETADFPGKQTAAKGAALVFAVLLLVNAQICNLAYMSSATAHRASEVFASNLVSRVESTKGYSSDMEVIIIGSFPRRIYHTSKDMFQPMEEVSCVADTVLTLNKHIYYYLNDWLNIPWQEPEESLMIAISDSDEFQAMPLYPDDGSVQLIDGRVVVKLAERYTPKRPFEVAYENRH